MSYNKAELTAMLIIAEKLNWNKPVDETIEIINQMVRNRQATDLDCVGECDDYEETLLSLALWDKDKIISCMYVTDYLSLQEWAWNIFCEDMGITSADMCAMMHWHTIKGDLLAPEYEEEENFARFAAEYNDADWDEFVAMSRENWIKNYCY